MDSEINIINPKQESPEIIDQFCMDEIFETISELPPLETYFELDSFGLPHNKNYGFEDRKVIRYPLLWDWNEDVVLDVKPLNSSTGIAKSTDLAENGCATTSICVNEKRVISGRKRRSVPLELKEIQKHFDVPITKAAKEMNVGLTVLKKRCRELNIMRWPHRKIKSLKSLIHNVKEMGLNDEIEMLEEHKKLVEEVPDMELTHRTKTLRQACFKANYKKRRCL